MKRQHQMKKSNGLFYKSPTERTDSECGEKHFETPVFEEGVSFCKQPQNGNLVRTSWRELSVHSYVKMVIIGGLFVYLFYNEIETIVGKWLTDSSWSHGFLIPLFSLYFIDQAKGKIFNLQTKPNYLGLFFMICGIVFYPLNIVHFQYGYLRPLGMIATLGAMVLFLGGWGLIRYT